MLLSKRELSVGINVNIHMSSGGFANYVPVGLRHFGDVLSAGPDRLQRILEETEVRKWGLAQQRLQYIRDGQLREAAEYKTHLQTIVTDMEWLKARIRGLSSASASGSTGGVGANIVGANEVPEGFRYIPDLEDADEAQLRRIYNTFDGVLRSLKNRMLEFRLAGDVARERSIAQTVQEHENELHWLRHRIELTQQQQERRGRAAGQVRPRDESAAWLRNSHPRF
jgi:hypothetical protein